MVLNGNIDPSNSLDHAQSSFHRETPTVYSYFINGMTILEPMGKGSLIPLLMLIINTMT